MARSKPRGGDDMAKGDLFINEIEIPRQSLSYSPGWIDFRQEERTIDNTLVSDLKAQKRIFSFSWGVLMDGLFVADILELYLIGDDVTFTETQADLTDVEYICQLKISPEYIREIESGNYAFSGFSISLEEV
jgi:hypothetical protein